MNMTRRRNKAGINTARPHHLPDLVASYRRDALKLRKAGRPQEAIRILAHLPMIFGEELEYGINFSRIDPLETQLAALKVLADASVQTGDLMNTCRANLIRADVDETEAILAG